MRSRRAPYWSIAVLFSLVTVASGCSVVFVQDARTADVQCTTSQLAPVLDAQTGIGSSAGVISSFIVASTTEDSNEFYAAMAGNAVVAAVSIYSALQGFEKVRRCQRYRTTTWIQRQTAEKKRTPPESDQINERESRTDTKKPPESEPTSRDRQEASSEPEGGDQPDQTPEQTGEKPQEDQPTAGDGAATDTGDDVDCDAESGRRCTDDGSCLSGDVCHPEKYRCVPKQCLESQTE